jgi:hypothetical protein
MKILVSTRIEESTLLKIKAGAATKNISASELIKITLESFFGDNHELVQESNQQQRDYGVEFQQILAELAAIKTISYRAQRSAIFAQFALSEGKSQNWIDAKNESVTKVVHPAKAVN